MYKMMFFNKIIKLSKVITFLLFFLIVFQYVDAFNLSLKPNQIFEDPQLPTAQNKTRSTYFGYSVCLRKNGIIIGAPRAQSTLEHQSKIDEPGAIYRCPIQTTIAFPNSPLNCTLFTFESNDNKLSSNPETDQYIIETEIRDYQLLGAVIEAGANDSNQLLVCAPHFKAVAYDYILHENRYHLHGICYWIKNTETAELENVTVKIKPLIIGINQLIQEGNEPKYLHMLGEEGFSAHVTDQNEFIIGAPGVHTWKGSLIHYHKKIPANHSLSRRDVSVRKYKQRHAIDSTYESEVLDPKLWNQADDSYFGYAVGSGYFDRNRTKLLYVATAPQASISGGEAYLFNMAGRSIEKIFTFKGEQLGEYFGYSILVVDVNGDGLSDVLISAPQYSFEDSHDNGAVYLFINRGNFEFEDKKIIIKSPINTNARFGTTLSSLGDINQDGFNDIAIGAPFAENGAIFIYLGDTKGLRTEYSQRLNSTLTTTTSYGGHMFGHSLSKGVDIDGNGFNDLAVGAPNAEAVFLYRAYPVIKIFAKIKPQTNAINTEQTQIQIAACYHFETKSTAVKEQALAIRMVADAQAKRVRFSNNKNEFSFTVNATTKEQCFDLIINVTYTASEVFKPIEIEMHYNIVNEMPNSEQFCETCVAVDPTDSKFVKEKIAFSNGCATDICVADLQLSSSDFPTKFTSGSSKTLKINYEILNKGESAYLPRLNVTSSNHMSFAQIQPNCFLANDFTMICDLYKGRTLLKDGKDSISIIFDVSSISGDSIDILAEVSSAGNEKNNKNNILHSHIKLEEHTEIYINGKQENAHIDLETYKNVTEILNKFDIISNGPSTVPVMDIILNIPIAYNVSGIIIPIVDKKSFNLQAKFNEQEIPINIIDANKKRIPIENIQQQISKNISNILDNSDNAVIKEQYTRIAKNHVQIANPETYKGIVPVERTIWFNCPDNELTICLRAELTVRNFKPDNSISLNMKFNVDLNEVNQTMIEPWEYFAILIDVNASRRKTTNTKVLSVVSNILPNIISKRQEQSCPIWVIILAVLGGLLLLGAATYAMYKNGFFKRPTRDLIHKGNIEAESVPLSSDIS